MIIHIIIIIIIITNTITITNIIELLLKRHSVSLSERLPTRKIRYVSCKTNKKK